MKKSFALGLMVALLCGLLTACPKKGPKPTPQPNPPNPPKNDLTAYNEAANKIKEMADKDGFKLEVAVEDDNNNGIPDFVITYISGHEDETVAFLVGYVTSCVGGACDGASFKTDLVVLKVSDQVFKAKIEDCIKCVGLVKKNAPKEEIGNCIISAWGLTE